MTREEVFNSDHEELKSYIAAMERKAGPFIEGLGTSFSDGRHVEMQRFTTGIVFAFKDLNGETTSNWVSDEAMYMLLNFYTLLYNGNESQSHYIKCCELTGIIPEQK